MLSLATLLLLKRCLEGQQLNVSDPNFRTVAPQVVAAMDELDRAIEATQQEAPLAPEAAQA